MSESVCRVAVIAQHTDTAYRTLKHDINTRVVWVGRELSSELLDHELSAPIDVIVVAVNAPGEQDPEFWLRLRAAFPSTPLVVLVSTLTANQLSNILVAGTTVLYPSSTPPEDLARLVRKAKERIKDYHPRLATRVAAYLENSPSSMHRIGGLRYQRQSDRFFHWASPVDLTNRETQVLELLGHGLSNRQVSLELGVSVKTTEFHVSNLYRKLGVASRIEAVLAGSLIDSPEG